MDDEKAYTRDWLLVKPDSGNDSQVACIIIDGEVVNLPPRFNVSIRPCSEGNDHLAVVTDDHASAEFAGRLEIAAAMGKQVIFLHAKLDSDELRRITEFIEADKPNWHEGMTDVKRWTVYPFRCDCKNSDNGHKTGLFSLSLM